MAWNDSRVTLSKSILEMKFMKRTKDKVEQQTYQKEGEDYFDNEITNRLKKQSGQFIIEPSYVFCEELIEGRLSFQGENPELERLMELEYMEKYGDQLPENETDITDAEMAAAYKGTTKINVKNLCITNSNGSQDEPRRKKPKYLKPAD